VGNPDASLSRVLPASGAVVGRGHDVHACWLGSVFLLRARSRHVAWERSLRSSGCRDHNGCISAPGCGNKRTGSVGEVAPSVNGADGGWARQSLVFREILTPATSPSRARGTTSVGTCDVIGRCRACFMSFYGKVGFYSLLGCLATGFDASQVRPHINSQHPNHQRRAPWGCLHSPFGLLPTPPWRANANSVKYLGRQISAYVGSHSQMKKQV
jgi:hypothetical protein